MHLCRVQWASSLVQMSKATVWASPRILPSSWGKKQNHHYYRVFYIYFDCGTNAGVQLTIKRWCPTLIPACSASEPDWTKDTKMPLSFPPIIVISDSRFSPERKRLCTGRNEFRWGPEVNEGRNGLKKQTKKGQRLINILANWGRPEMTETMFLFFSKSPKRNSLQR